MSGVGGLFSPAWFRQLILIAQKIMPEVRRDFPNDDDTWLLAKALARAHYQREAEKKARKEQAKPPPPKQIGTPHQ